MKINDRQALILYDIAKWSLNVAGNVAGYDSETRHRLVNEIISQQNIELVELENGEGPVYKVGYIFEYEGKEYRLRVINYHKQCFLEPVISRGSSQCVTGGLNITCDYKDLGKLKLVTTQYA